MRRFFPIAAIAVLALAEHALVQAAPVTPVPAQPGQLYAHYGWGSYRSQSVGLTYGRNPGGTGAAYDYQPRVTGASGTLAIGYVMSDSHRRPAWLGANPRLEFAFGYAAARWSGLGRSPTGTKVPFLDNRTPNLQLSTVPANDDQFSQELTNKSYDLLLTTDYHVTPGRLTVTPFLGVSRIARRETARLTSFDPIAGRNDLVLSERLDADYAGPRAGATLTMSPWSGWHLTLGASRSWLRADARLGAEQAFPTYPAPPGLSMQLNDAVNGKSADRTTYVAGVGHDSGWARVDLIVERNYWSYVPAAANPMLYTDPRARLDARRVTDTAVRLMFTVPIGR